MSNKPNVKTPNHEQVIAINHSGGKILSAGAGSGKTFVLIEHLVKRISHLKLDIPQDQFKSKIPIELSKIVLMTFTKKAAGEMSIRMLKKLDELCENSTGLDLVFWSIVRQNLGRLNITTISSFCHQLIGQGFFPQLNPDVQVLSKVEFKNKINTLFNSWFVSKKNELGQVFESNSTALVSAMIEIYNSPELRMMWKEELLKSNPEEEINFFIAKLYTDLKLKELFLDVLPGENEILDKKELGKSWFVFLSSLKNLVKNEGELEYSNIKSYFNWASNLGRAPAETKAMTDDQKNALRASKLLVKKLVEIENDFVNFIDHYDIYWKWVETYQDLFLYIDKNYFNDPGYSFSDLEYFTCIGLKENSVLEKVIKFYNYFIVDEFQDTSSVQYEILKTLIGSNQHKLFCVGDKKQAIYGFRGGELQVFTQCSNLLGESNQLELKYNFRSSSKVINFNNNFFKLIFPLGLGFENLDKHSVMMDEQKIPDQPNSTGEVVKYQTMIHGPLDSKGLDCDAYEAEALFELTKKILVREDIQSVCVLYRRLKPSTYLLELLTKENIPFSAQVKVQYNEDPIINLFIRCLELKLNLGHNKKTDSTYFLMKNLIEIISGQNLIEDHFYSTAQIFIKDLDILGLRLSFHKFVYGLGISNSLYQENSQLLDSICKVCNEDPVLVYNLLSSEGEESYSFERLNGPRAKRIIIMSAHASKGLEFDAVFLGGIHSNGTSLGKTEIVGKLPRSFKWKKIYNQKGFYKTPMYYHELEIDKEKDFSESKRLLYVANTRAVKFFAWIDLNLFKSELDVEPLSTSGNHWIKAFRMLSTDSSLFKEESLDLRLVKPVIASNVPLAIRDQMGLFQNLKITKLGIFAETSVTGLSQLIQCPFKFYLSTICKITPPENAKFHNLIDDRVNEEDEENSFFSTKKRGTQIHQTLSDLLTNKIEPSLISKKSNVDSSKIIWAYEEALKIGNQKKIVSEKLIKFPFFGQMISGTPDLVFEGQEEVIVWDFKTGRRDENTEESYWFQLMCYGYAYAKLKCFSPEKTIPLSLVYLDEMNIVTKKMNLHHISEFLFENWIKTESLTQVNKHHCPKCEYSSICIYSIKN